MYHDLLQPGGEVLNVLHPWHRPPPVPKYLFLGPHAQLRPLLGPGVPPWHNPEGEPIIPWDEHAAPTNPSKVVIAQG